MTTTAQARTKTHTVRGIVNGLKITDRMKADGEIVKHASFYVNYIRGDKSYSQLCFATGKGLENIAGIENRQRVSIYGAPVLAPAVGTLPPRPALNVIGRSNDTQEADERLLSILDENKAKSEDEGEINFDE